MGITDWEYDIRAKYFGISIFIVPSSRMYHGRGTSISVALPFKKSYL
jgi:hypothetical protein